VQRPLPTCCSSKRPEFPGLLRFLIGTFCSFLTRVIASEKKLHRWQALFLGDRIPEGLLQPPLPITPSKASTDRAGSRGTTDAYGLSTRSRTDCVGGPETMAINPNPSSPAGGFSGAARDRLQRRVDIRQTGRLNRYDSRQQCWPGPSVKANHSERDDTCVKVRLVPSKARAGIVVGVRPTLQSWLRLNNHCHGLEE